MTTNYTNAQNQAKAWLDDIVEMVAALDTQDDEARENAKTRIHESALSVQIRSCWHLVGEGTNSDGEFEILLSTGGPACRIIGDLCDSEPTSATLQYQDWGAQWIPYTHPDPYGPKAALLEYCQQFYFGE